MKDSLQETSERLQSFFNSTSDAINITNIDGELLYVNPSFEKMYGWTKEELLGKPLPIIPNQLHEEEKRRRAILLEGEHIRNWEAQLIRKNGSKVDVSITISPLKNADSSITGFAAITRDETARKKTEMKLREKDEKYRIIAENSSDLIRLIDRYGQVQYASPSHETLLGFTPEELVGRHFEANIHPEDSPRINKLFRDIIMSPKTIAMEYRIKHRDGHLIFIEAHCAPVFEKENKLSHYIVVSRDISERKQYEKRLKEFAYFDPLTGVANRRLFQQQLSEKIEKAEQNNHMLALLYLDFDRFKWVNDTMGHDIGDELLKQFVDRIQKTLRTSDFIYRLGGDEFAVILSDIHSKEDIIKIAECMTSELQIPWNINDHRFVTTGSIGISVFPYDGEDKHTLLSHADHALYQAKEEGRNLYRFYTNELEKKINRMIVLENDLKHAINNQHFYLVYQPQINLRTGITECLEVLLRYEHPLLGNISPDEFIPICEKTGLINEITVWILEQVGIQYKDWMDSGYTTVKFAINISPISLQNEESYLKLTDALNKAALPSYNLELEITEQALLNELDEIRIRLAKIKEMGISVSLDDFGSGYSSLVYFKQLPIDKLKIDKTFLQDINSEQGTKDQAIVKAISTMAKELNIEVVCEGLETKEQYLYLLKNNLMLAQGYYFSKPVIAIELEKSGLIDKVNLNGEIILRV